MRPKELQYITWILMWHTLLFPKFKSTNSIYYNIWIKLSRSAIQYDKFFEIMVAVFLFSRARTQSIRLVHDNYLNITIAVKLFQTRSSKLVNAERLLTPVYARKGCKCSVQSFPASIKFQIDLSSFTSHFQQYVAPKTFPIRLFRSVFQVIQRALINPFLLLFNNYFSITLSCSKKDYYRAL